MSVVRLYAVDAHQLTLPPEYLTGWVTPAPTVNAAAAVASLRADGLGPSAVARRLNLAGTPTPSGLVGRWRPETVLRVENPAGWSAYMRSYRARRR